MQETKTTTMSRIIQGLVAIIVVLLVFKAGTHIGFRRGIHSSNMMASYTRSFDDPRSMFNHFVRDETFNSKAVMGKIVAFNSPAILIKGYKTERVVIVSPTTTIKTISNSHASTSNLTAGENILVIGEPGENGTIQADFIRVMPGPGERPHSVAIPTEKISY